MFPIKMIWIEESGFACGTRFVENEHFPAKTVCNEATFKLNGSIGCHSCTCDLRIRIWRNIMLIFQVAKILINGINWAFLWGTVTGPV